MKVTLLDINFKDQIVGLRKKAFSEKYGSRVDLRGLEWNRQDQSGFHFGVLENDILVSTLRLSYHYDPKGFEALMQFPADHEFSSLPCYCLARAASLNTTATKSLNMYLRLAAFQYVQNNPKSATAIFGTALAESKRINFLKEIGYEVTLNPKPWNGYFKSDGKDVAILKLPLNRVHDSIKVLSTKMDLAL